MSGRLTISVSTEASEEAVAAAMSVMTPAFPPEFGEAWSIHQLCSMMRLPGAQLVIGKLDEQPVGFALLRSIAGEAELLLLAVHPSHRGRGHGKRLLDRCMAEAEAGGAQAMFLEVRRGNPALHLYNKAGFIQYNIRRDYYTGCNGQRTDALSLKMILRRD
ncbi:MAG TPA: GNAT family N-acetyltransferase [Sphingobium sp.]|nr:GNAT family N-acetyltransferase [Sphingobium sp.]